jgi:hypothetical protein
MMFQIVRLEISQSGSVVARQEAQPLFELQQDAMAMAEFEAARYYEQHEYDRENDCWTACDRQNRKIRFVVEPLSNVEIGV